MGNVPMKKVVNSDPGDVDHAGGNDWDDLVDFLNNLDKTGPVKINTRTYFRSGKLEFRNPADTASLIHIIPAIAADRNINWPLITAADEPLMKAFAATIQNKTLDGTCDVSAAAGSGAVTGASYITLANDATLTAERVLTAGDGLSLTDSGANGTATITPDLIDSVRKRVGFVEDCLGSPTTNTNLQYLGSGTGATTYGFNPAATGVFGIWNLDTGTTTTGRAALILGNDPNIFSLGQGLATFETYIKLPILSTAVEEYQIRIGFGDSYTGSFTDGAYFTYERLTSVNWIMQCKSNGTLTSSNSTTVVGTGWVRLKIVVNAAGTSVAFFVNGTEVSGSPLTTNIPTGAGRELGIVMSIIKSAGTTSRSATLDYMVFDYDLTTPR